MRDAAYQQLRDTLRPDDADGAARLEREARRRGDAFALTLARCALQRLAGDPWSTLMDDFVGRSADEVEAIRVRLDISLSMFARDAWLRHRDPRLLLCGQLAVDLLWFREPVPLPDALLKNIHMLSFNPLYNRVPKTLPGYEVLARTPLEGLRTLKFHEPPKTKDLRSLMGASWLRSIEELHIRFHPTRPLETLAVLLAWPLDALRVLHASGISDEVCQRLAALQEGWPRQLKALHFPGAVTPGGVRTVLTAPGFAELAELHLYSSQPLPVDVLSTSDALPALRTVHAQRVQGCASLLELTEQLAAMVERGIHMELSELSVGGIGHDRKSRKQLREALREGAMDSRAWVVALGLLGDSSLQGVEETINERAGDVLDGLSDPHALVRAGAHVGWWLLAHDVSGVNVERVIRIARCPDEESWKLLGRLLCRLEGDALREAVLGVFEALSPSDWSCCWRHVSVSGQLAARDVGPLRAGERERILPLIAILLARESAISLAWFFLAILPEGTDERQRILTRCLEEAQNTMFLEAVWAFVRPSERRWALSWCAGSSAAHHRNWAQSKRVARTPEQSWEEALALVGSLSTEDLALGLGMMVRLCERFLLAREYHERVVSWMDSAYRVELTRGVREHLLSHRAQLSWLDSRVPAMFWSEIEHVSGEVLSVAVEGLERYAHADDLEDALRGVLRSCALQSVGPQWHPIGQAMIALALDPHDAVALLQEAGRPPKVTELGSFLRDLQQATPRHHPEKLARRRFLLLLRVSAGLRR